MADGSSNGAAPPPIPLADQLLQQGATLTTTADRVQCGEKFLRSLTEFAPVIQDSYIKAGASVFGFRAETARLRVQELKAEAQLHPLIGEFEEWADHLLTSFPPQAPSEEAVLAQVKSVGTHLARAEDKVVRELGWQKAVALLRALKVPQAEALVGDAITQAAAQARGGLDGTDAAPWPDPVDGLALTEGLKAVYQQYVVASEETITALTLFTLLSHTYNSFDILPNLLIKSPIKRCGKTRVLEVAGSLVRRPLMVSNVSAAAIYRSVELWQPTLILDEADSFLTGKYNTPSQEELRNVVNSGHTRATAWVLRVAGDNRDEPRKFPTWAPKILACIGDLPDTIEDRSIIVVMRRRLQTEAVARWRHNYREQLAPWQRQAARWALDHATELRGLDPAELGGLNDREQDCWRPLFALAELIGGTWPEASRTAATLLSQRTAEHGSAPVGQLLLTHIQEAFHSQDPVPDRMSSAAILQALLARPESPWLSYKRGQLLTDRDVADLLRPFDIRTVSMDIKEPNLTVPGGPPTIHVRKGLYLSKIQDVLDRYAFQK